MSESVKKPFGFSIEDLNNVETVYRDDLFKDKVVLVSGAGSGLGQAIAFLFGRLGAKLFICGRNPDKLTTTVDGLEALGITVKSKSMTIRDSDQVSELIDDVWDAYGQLDFVINNAGGQFPQAALDFKVKGWQAVIDTNLNGTWYMMQFAAKRWVAENHPGSIINIVADFWRGMPGIAHTCAARAAVTYLSKTVAVEWAPHKIRVNCVAPGCVETPGFNVYPEEGSATFEESNPMKETGDAQDIAESCVYLAASSGKFITGEVITVDGGQQMWGDPWPIGRPDYFKL